MIVNCPQCQARIKGDDRYAGHDVACPACKSRVHLPTSAESAPPRSGNPAASNCPPRIPDSAAIREPSSPEEKNPTSVAGHKTDRNLYLAVGGTLLLLVIGVLGLVAPRTFDTEGRPYRASGHLAGHRRRDKRQADEGTFQRGSTTYCV